jgi:hypothetical protein
MQCEKGDFERIAVIQISMCHAAGSVASANSCESESYPIEIWNLSVRMKNAQKSKEGQLIRYSGRKAMSRTTGGAALFIQRLHRVTTI